MNFVYVRDPLIFIELRLYDLPVKFLAHFNMREFELRYRARNLFLKVLKGEVSR